MKDNSENIPSEIFDWLEKRNFDELSVAEKDSVLEHLGEETYRELHQVATGVKGLWQEEISRPQTPVKQQLLDRFDALHGHKKTSVGIWRTAGIWRAAAIFLFGISGALAYVLMVQQHSSNTAIALVRDTVYLNRESASAVTHIYDTVYIENPAKMATGAYKPSPRTASRSKVTAPPADNEALSVLSIRELRTRANIQKKNSMKHDSSARKYRFVNL